MTAMSEGMEKKLSQREYRDADGYKPSTDEAKDEYVITGCASRFNSKYTLYEDEDFRILEQVDSHAFDGCDMTDVIMQYNHEGHVLARTRNGTLKVEATEDGLMFEADLSGTTISKQAYEEVRGGFTDKMSFGFHVAEDEMSTTVEPKENGKTMRVATRTIKRIDKLYDVSLVSIPANDATSVSARSYIHGVMEAAEAERLMESRRKALELRIRILTGGSK